MQNKELSLRDMFDVVWRKRKFIAVTVFIITILAIVISLLLPKWYKATAVIISPSSTEIPFGAGSILGQFGLGDITGANVDNSRFIAILKSKTLLETFARKYDLQNRYDCENMERTLKALEGNMQVEIGEEDQISISFWDRDQELVAEMTNYIVQCLDSLNIALFTGQARNKRKFIESRMDIVQDSLVLLEDQISQFMKNKGVLSFDDQVRAGITAAAELKAEITSKEIQLAVAQKTMYSNAALIRRLQLEINGLKKKYQEFYSSNSNNRLFPNLNDIPELGIKYLQIQRKAEYYAKVLEFLGPQFEQAKIEEAKEIPTLQVLDHATRPERKDKPRRAKIVIISFGLSLILISYIAYIWGRWIEISSQKGE